MAPLDLSEYKGLYIKTAREYVSQIKTNLEILKKSRDNKDAIETIFIAAHSIKGQSQIMKYPQVSNLCSAIETIFRTLKEHQQPTTDAIIQALQPAADWLAGAINSIEKSNTEPDASDEVARMRTSML